MDSTKFNIELFLALNEEYANKRVANPTDDPNLSEARGRKRADRLERLFGLSGKRVLEVGCGRGELAAELATRGCHVLAVDIKPYREWAERRNPSLTFLAADLSQSHALPAGSVDVLCSFSVMEHVRDPIAMLRACKELLAPDGRFLLAAHLYRAATGSHRAREVFFPWPHLLFTDDVFEEFYRRQGRAPHRPAWLNKLTHADYFSANRRRRRFDRCAVPLTEQGREETGNGRKSTEGR